MKTELAKYNNSWYKPGNSVKRAFWYFFNIIFLMNPWNPFNGSKKFVLRLFGAKIGKGLIIKPHVSIKYPWNLVIGNHVWIGEDVWIDNLAKVTIKDNVCISQGCLLLCGNHNYKKTSFDLIIGEITLEEGSWAGAKTVICPGVRLGKNSLLTVGSIATSSLEENWIYQGNPAKKLKLRVLKN